MLYIARYLTLIIVINISTCYAEGSYWVSGGQLTQCGQKAVELLAQAAEEGLNPARYQFAVNAAKSSSATTSEQIDRAMIQYVDDVRNGSFNPRIADRRVYMKPDPVNAAAIVAQGKASGSCQWMYQQAPPYPGYQRLKELLKQNLWSGNKAFLQKIAINMERWRWMPRNHPNRYIIVNVAGYELEAIENGKTMVKSPIIVGKAQLPTPVFTGIMVTVDFNPSWHVPHGIAAGEELARIKSNPSAFFGADRMTLYRRAGKGLVSVNPSTVNWSKYSSKNFPFVLIQRPGPNNALGKIRFNIQSPFNIFLHSTPSQYLFDYKTRNFSHGCIRVKEVVSLAYFALNNPSLWTPQTIQREMEGAVTKVVKLPQSIPVYINYFTVWVDENGTPNYFPDAYGEDQRLWAVLSRY